MAAHAAFTTNVSATFVYDGDGKMVKSVIDGVVTIFVSAAYQVKNPTGDAVVTKYYEGGVMRKGGVLYYSLTDHIGSTSITIDPDGNKTEMRYTAWGEVRYQSGSLPTDRTYTGQRSYASDFGLMYYNARWYDSSVGRFAQADNIDVKVGDTQSLDRFAYVGNNPILRNDPSGHIINILIGALIGAVAGPAILGLDALAHPGLKLTAQDYAAATLVGMGAGALIGSGVGAGAGLALGAEFATSVGGAGVVAAAGVGAGTGAAGAAIGYTVAAGNNYNSGKMATAAVIGGATGALTSGSGALFEGLGPVPSLGAQVANRTTQIVAPVAQGLLQTAAFNVIDNKPSYLTPGDLVSGGFAGGIGGFAGVAVNTIAPGMGPFVSSTIASGGGDFWQNEVDKHRQQYQQQY
jgi:RHS repeat-associated protein